MRIILVRHGEPNYELDCLTSSGWRQAEAAAERLAGEGIEAIYSSPMGRARETAEATALRLGFTHIETLPFMHELYWGSRDGSEMFARGNPWDIVNKMVSEGADFAKPYPLFDANRVMEEAEERAAGVDAWLETLGYRRKGLYYTCCREDDTEHTVALFAHGGSLSAVVAHLFNLPFPQVCAILHMPFTGICIVKLDSHPGAALNPEIELANDGRHIEGITVRTGA
ncbi:MAG: histidine phosphatase family protein [Clostridia bacterium]|nr:histidine phosphatase family protein [Clostridia bacterium]